MSNFICTNENGVIYIESKSGDVLGICSATQITDGDGIAYEEDIFTVLENYNFDIDQNWEDGETILNLVNDEDPVFVVFNNGEVSIRFSE